MMNNMLESGGLDLNKPAIEVLRDLKALLVEHDKADYVLVGFEGSEGDINFLTISLATKAEVEGEDESEIITPNDHQVH